MANRVVQAKVADLRPWDDNPRTITDERLDSLKRSLEAEREMLDARPLIALTDGTVIAGNQRLRAAQELGWDKIPTVYVDLDRARAVEWALRDNQPYGETDDALTAGLLRELAAGGRDLDLTGYSSDAIDDLLRSFTPGPAKDPDAVPPLPAKAKSKRGEVYELGPHRLMCGDSANTSDVATLTEGQIFHAVVTDPPYGIEREGITNDSPDTLRALFDDVLAAAPLHDAVIVAFQSPRLVIDWIDAVRAADHHWERLLWLHRQASKTYPWRGWVLASDAIAVSTIGDPQWPDPADFCHDTYVKTELEDATLTGTHTTIKPSWIVRDLMSKLPPGAVYEPFAGSGTAVIAAEQLGRRCVAMEIDPGYCDVIRQRYEDYTRG